MTLANMIPILRQASAGRFGLIGFVVQGWEDARAYVEAGSKVDTPIILQAGPACLKHTPLKVISKMFTVLAEMSKSQVVLHLDHATDIDNCKAALDEGFTFLALSEALLSRKYKPVIAKFDGGFFGFSIMTFAIPSASKPTTPYLSGLLTA